jgi:hypothetical protein
MRELTRPCNLRGLQGLFFIVAILLLTSGVRAQSPPLVAAWGFNGGFSAAPTSKGPQIEAFYDVPIGHVLFSPGIKVMFSDNSMFSMDTRIRFRLFSDWLLFGFGGNLMVWEDRAAIGIPLEFSHAIQLKPRFQLNTGIHVTPHFFIGKEKDGVMYTAFIGIRFPLL